MKKIILFLAVTLLCGCGGQVYKVGDYYNSPNDPKPVMVFKVDATGKSGYMATMYDVGGEGLPPGTGGVSVSSGYPWSYNSNHIETSPDFGEGKSNTWNIITSQGMVPDKGTPYAARLCHNLGTGVVTGDNLDLESPFQDWYLPSMGELVELHKAMVQQAQYANAPSRVGMYWSSTEVLNNPKAARYLNFYENPGLQSEFLKFETAKVRCIRKF